MLPTPENIKAVRDAIPPEILSAIVRRELDEQIARAQADRAERRLEREGVPAQPETGRFAAVRSGAHRRRSRPVSDPEDRRYVAGALRHWRQVHGLSQRQAQERIGYRPTSSSWAHWEQGFVVPPYRTLLKIIASTGLGYWVDRKQRAGIPADLLLEVDAAGRR